MSVVIDQPGLLTTIQDQGRSGWRHMGVPFCGAADPLSLALANRLVGNSAAAPGLEMTLTGATLRFNLPTVFALAGGSAEILLNGRPTKSQHTCRVQIDDQLSVGPVRKGARTYLAVAGGFRADEVFGSKSTYLPASFGGHHGRIVKAGDVLKIGNAGAIEPSATPAALTPFISDGWILRVVAGAEFEFMDPASGAIIFSEPFAASNRASRMGIELIGQHLKTSTPDIPSSPVFPGTVQCPANGNPFLLMADAQTTGGYPRIAQVIRADRHLMGQIRPGDTIRLMRVTTELAGQILRKKSALYENWLGYCPFT